MRHISVILLFLAVSANAQELVNPEQVRMADLTISDGAGADDSLFICQVPAYSMIKMVVVLIRTATDGVTGIDVKTREGQTTLDTYTPGELDIEGYIEHDETYTPTGLSPEEVWLHYSTNADASGTLRVYVYYDVLL